ncbi:thiamine pyrophosphate-dependent enzyme [uncultured Acetobacterium sp.]
MSERPAQFISSGGLGSICYGLGASIGVKLANPIYKQLQRIP